MDEQKKIENTPQPEPADPGPGGAGEKPASSGRGWKIALLLTLVVILGAAAVILTLDGRHVRFRLVESAEITVPFGEPFKDPGRSAITVGRFFGEGRLQLPVQTIGTVDTNTLGTYELTYSTRFLLDTYSTTRIVHVVDMTPPIITLETIEGYQPSWFSGYEEEGYTAWDACDGDLTDKVERTDFGDRIQYVVTDAAGNTAVVFREPDFARGQPEMKLLGEETMTVSAGFEFEDPGCMAVDAEGEDVTEFVKVEGRVIPYQAGTYELVYSLESEAGDVISLTRTVIVEPVELPETVQPSEKTIYLTFDDGPGPYTEHLLDVLATYDVKVTFFVTGLNPEYEDLIGRAYREGHTIAVHTASHNYYQIYDSEQAYFEDFREAQDMIYRQTGERPRMFRFPGGSSNTVSSFNPGVISSLASCMHDMGYQYYDWNVDSDDAGSTNSTYGVAENVILGCSEYNTAIVLQHDIKDYSVAAVEQIILWGQRNGYTFRALDLSSPTAHHRIAN